jgi:uncharacterized phiE125 gp8 family phage protein
MNSLTQPIHVTSLLGPLSLVTAAASLPVTRDECKDQCGQKDFDDDDLMLDRKIEMAVRAIERGRGWQLMQATFDVAVRAWWNVPLRLPRPPLASITSVKYYDTAGVLTTLDPSYYLVHTPSDKPGSIERSPLLSWPATQCRAFPIIIRFVAGYASRALVPGTFKEAIYQLVDFSYENRGAADAELPSAIDHLLDLETSGGYA